MKRILILSLVFLVGCSTKPTQKPQPLQPEHKASWQVHQERIQNMHRWQAQGKMAAKKGNEGGQANFTWKQNASEYQIDVFGPFGAGHVQIFGAAHGVRLTDHQNHDYHAATAEGLFHKVAGWTVPISGMRYWIRGIPDPDANIAYQRFDGLGRLAVLIQDGWQIDYERYEHHPVTPMPTKLRLTNKDASVKLIVKNWRRNA